MTIHSAILPLASLAFASLVVIVAHAIREIIAGRRSIREMERGAADVAEMVACGEFANVMRFNWIVRKNAELSWDGDDYFVGLWSGEQWMGSSYEDAIDKAMGDCP